MHTNQKEQKKKKSVDYSMVCESKDIILHVCAYIMMVYLPKTHRHIQYINIHNIFTQILTTSVYIQYTQSNTLMFVSVCEWYSAGKVWNRWTVSVRNSQCWESQADSRVSRWTPAVFIFWLQAGSLSKHTDLSKLGGKVLNVGPSPFLYMNESKPVCCVLQCLRTG